jgi:hypothetical protein
VFAIEEVMTYRLVQLAPGSYDLECGGVVIASVVQEPPTRRRRQRWSAELIDERVPYPPPFTALQHHFENLAAVIA